MQTLSAAHALGALLLLCMYLVATAGRRTINETPRMMLWRPRVRVLRLRWMLCYCCAFTEWRQTINKTHRTMLSYLPCLYAVRSVLVLCTLACSQYLAKCMHPTCEHARVWLKMLWALCCCLRMCSLCSRPLLASLMLCMMCLLSFALSVVFSNSCRYFMIPHP